MVASLEVGDGVQVRSRSPLFPVNAVELGSPFGSYDIDSEGARFLMILEAGGAEAGQRVLVLNVFEELDELTAAGN